MTFLTSLPRPTGCRGIPSFRETFQIAMSMPPHHSRCWRRRAAVGRACTAIDGTPRLVDGWSEKACTERIAFGAPLQRGATTPVPCGGPRAAERAESSAASHMGLGESVGSTQARGAREQPSTGSVRRETVPFRWAASPRGETAARLWHSAPAYKHSGTRLGGWRRGGRRRWTGLVTVF